MADCVFCRIATGEIPSSKVYEDGGFLAILDLYPANKGHVLVLPKRHSEQIEELTEEEAAGMVLVVQTVVRALKKAFGCPGVNVLQNNGKDAGQLIMHNHFHVIPRYPEDGLLLKWPRNTYAEGEIEQYRQKISDAMTPA
ncbi:MAG: HIT family protein [Candidatus Micrarchaeota archaeon]